VVVTRTLRLDQLVDGLGAQVVVQLDHDAGVLDAWFVLDGLPRVESVLKGRPIATVPTLVEHLCGICPVAHHLAGARAMDSLSGFGAMTPTARAVRRLAHHGEVLQTHARQLTSVNPVRALDVRSFARRALTAAAGPGHFPHCAVPGGVVSTVTVAQRDALRDDVDRAVEQAADLVDQIRREAVSRLLPAFTGCDAGLVDPAGALDLYGDQLRVVSATGSVVIAAAEPGEWPSIMAEARPGAAAPRPYLQVLGPGRGRYRVGPVAQLRVADHLSTAGAEKARQRWAAANGGATWARAVVALHAVEVIQSLTDSPELVAGPLVAPMGDSVHASDSPTVAIGWVDGARGLLVHMYEVGERRELVEARITTPTAQNEGWLADLLTTVIGKYGLYSRRREMRLPDELLASMEAAVREADPCLPCTSLPLNTMELGLTALDAEGNTVASWASPQRDSGNAAKSGNPCA
jgi:NAD-reducing hydrogenase large subunit